MKKLLFTNNAGISMGAVIGGIALLGVIVASIFLFKPDVTAPDSVQTATPGDGSETFFGTNTSSPHSAAIAALLSDIMGDNYDSAEFRKLFQSQTLDIEGDILDPGLDIINSFYIPFEAGSNANDIINQRTGNSLTESSYYFLFVETAGPVSDSEVSRQLGLGFAPAGAPTSVFDPDSLEPIANTAHASAIFGFDTGLDNKWQQVSILNVANNFSPTGDMALIFFDDASPFAAAFVPTDVVGQPGQPGLITMQMFGRQTPLGGIPSLDDPTGVSGFNLEIDSFDSPLNDVIFADGFESGDTSAWSQQR